MQTQCWAWWSPVSAGKTARLWFLLSGCLQVLIGLLTLSLRRFDLAWRAATSHFSAAHNLKCCAVQRRASSFSERSLMSAVKYSRGKNRARSGPRWKCHMFVSGEMFWDAWVCRLHGWLHWMEEPNSNSPSCQNSPLPFLPPLFVLQVTRLTG